MKILMRADTHVNIEVPGNAPVAKCTFSQVLAAFSVSLGSMVVGFASSYTSPALTTMKDGNITSFRVDDETGSWIGSLMPLSALFGGIAGGPLIEYIGRRNTILFTAFPFIFSWLLIGLAVNVVMILLGRMIGGFAVGVISLSLPVYLGETIQPEVRGSLGLLPTAFGNIGILLCFTAGMYLDWWRLALLGALLPVPFALCMIIIPETPRWYISKGKTKRARKSLQWLRGKQADVSEELTTVEKMHVEAERQVSSQQGPFGELFKDTNLKPLLISLGLMFFQQMSGINAVIFYTVQIFEDAGSKLDPNISTIIVGIVNFGSTFVATTLIDRLGRKILLYTSSVSMIVSLASLGAFFFMKNHHMDVSAIGWLPLTSFVVYVIGFSLGFGPIPWLMMGEILPAKIRGSAASVATSFNWTCTFVVTKCFMNIVALIGQEGTFWLFMIICLLGLIFVIGFVPETSGRSLEEIERGLTGPVRRMSAVANIKPTPMAC
uniref:Major facilitator superfamily (MFS) profile domain-containing protein n=1 Tax=Trichogramma kaykai TaxID=54128 RepID=A0ABD2X646_9HYME